FPARCLRGRQLRLEGELRTERVQERAGLWLRVDGSSDTLFFDNMHNRLVRGSTGWTAHGIAVTLPEKTEWINYGILLVGGGTVWVDNLRVLVAAAAGAMVSLNLWNDALPSVDDQTT